MQEGVGNRDLAEESIRYLHMYLIKDWVAQTFPKFKYQSISCTFQNNFKCQ